MPDGCGKMEDFLPAVRENEKAKGCPDIFWQFTGGEAMQDMDTRFMELASMGFECSQILMMLFLEMEGRENPDLIRAMGGLTGGAAVLGYFTARGEYEEMEHEKSREIIASYAQWFEETYGAEYGGCNCQDIIGGDYSKCLLVCAPIVQECFEKIMELLTEYEILEC